MTVRVVNNPKNHAGTKMALGAVMVSLRYKMG